jgi:hypothetical protein
MKSVAPPSLNAIGKPYSASYDPNYRVKYAASTGHLRFPYRRIKFVGEELRETQRGTQRRHKQQPQAKESATAALNWKENARKHEFTAWAPPPIGGRYTLSPFLHCWNVDYREKRGQGRRQLGFAYTLDEAKAIAEANNAGHE